jgi:hypothetical protein
VPGLEPFLPSLTLEPWLCHGCGFWQRLADEPAHCPVCLDSRHVQPPDGWHFERASAVRVRNVVDEPEPGVLRILTEPGIGIGPMGYVVDGVAFEGTTLLTEPVLADVVGPLRAISASHPHSYGALWQLQDANPDAQLALPAADFAWSAAFRVTRPYDDRLDLGGGLTLHVTGGHFPGHAVLHDARRGILFCGDALKFELDPADERRAVAVSAHKAFVRGVPLTRNEVLRYRRTFEALDFEQTWTPFEQARNVGRREVLRFLDGLLADRPHPEPVSL